METAKEKFEEYVEEQKEFGLIDIHFDAVPGASEEHIYEELLRLNESIDRGEYREIGAMGDGKFPDSDKPKIDVREYVKTLSCGSKNNQRRI